MALDLGQTTLQLLSAMDGVAQGAVSRAQRLSDTLERGLSVSADAATSRTAAVGRRPYISARTGPEGLLGSIPPPEAPRDWSALSVDGSHIDVDRHLPLRCHLINLGGCALVYGQNPDCRMFSEPALAVDDQDLYLRCPDDPSDEVLIAGPLLGALRTVREVERLADAVADLPQDRPALALLDGTLAFGTCSAATTLASSPTPSSASSCMPPSPACGRPQRMAGPWPSPPTPPDPEPTRWPAPSASCSATSMTTLRATAAATRVIPTGYAATMPPASTTGNSSRSCWSRDTARPGINPAVSPPASPWASPWARTGTVSSTSTAAPRSPASRSPTG